MSKHADSHIASVVERLFEDGTRRFLGDLAELSSALVANEPEDIPTWCRNNLFMPSEKTTRGGPIILTPIQAAIARFWQTPGVEQVTFLKPPRIGSSFLNAAGLLYYACHEGQDVIFYERSETTAQEFNNDKLMPILRNSVSVANLLRPDTKAGEQDRWTDRMLMNGAGLKFRSVSNNGAFRGIRGRFICADEAGSPEYNATGKRSEGSKLDLIRRRGQEFSDFVLYVGGTPTKKGECNVSAEYEKSDKRHFVMTFPCCQHRAAFVPDVRQAIPADVKHGPGIRYTVDDRGVPDRAWYECEACGAHVAETAKVGMMETGVFEPTAVGDRGHVGVYAWAAHSTDPKSTWRHIAQAHLNSLRDPDALPVFDNMWLAQPHVPPIVRLTEISDLEKRGQLEEWGRKEGGPEAPAWAEYLFAGIDVQEGNSTATLEKDGRIEMVVIAAGANRRHAAIDHVVLSKKEWVDEFGEIRERYVRPFKDADSEDMILEAVGKTYRTEDGRDLRIRRTFIDANYLNKEVLEFTGRREAKRAGLIASRGAREVPGSPRKLLPPKGMSFSQRYKQEFLWLGTQSAKTSLGRDLMIPPPAPKSWTFAHKFGESFYRSLLSEHRVEKKPGIFMWDRIDAAETGEVWDCLVYAIAAEAWEAQNNERVRAALARVDEIALEAAAAAQEVALAKIADPVAASAKAQDLAQVEAFPPPAAPPQISGSPSRQSGGLEVIEPSAAPVPRPVGRTKAPDKRRTGGDRVVTGIW